MRTTITTYTAYEHTKSYFLSKITFFWINKFLYTGFKTPLEQEILGELPKEESSERFYLKFKAIYNELVVRINY